MLSVEPILERMFLISGPVAELTRGAGRAAVLVVVELGRGARDTGGFFSGAAAVVVLLVVVDVFVRRGRVLAMLVVVDVLTGVVLGRAASAVFSVAGFFSSGLLSVFVTGRRVADALDVGRVEVAVRVVVAGLFSVVADESFLGAVGRADAGACVTFGTDGRFSVAVLGLTSLVTAPGAAAFVLGRVDAAAGRLVPAAGVGALSTGAFLLRGAGALVDEVGVGRLGAVVAVEAELGRGFKELSLVAPATGLVFLSGLVKSFPGTPLVTAGLAAEVLAAGFLTFSLFSSFSALAGFFSADSTFSVFFSALSSVFGSTLSFSSLRSSFLSSAVSCSSLISSALTFSVFTSAFST